TGNMVIDIGGGTTEIAVIALSGIVSDTSIRTGGDELDMAIVQFMRKNYNLLVGESTAEQVKIQIGSAAPIGDEREMEVKGRDLVSGIPKTVRAHSSGIREAIQEPIQQIVDAVRRALEITPPELASDIVDRGIVMTGGGALIRGLDLLLSQETGLPIHVDEDPLTCVVRGTGRILDDEEKYWSVLSTRRSGGIGGSAKQSRRRGDHGSLRRGLARRGRPPGYTNRAHRFRASPLGGGAARRPAT